MLIHFKSVRFKNFLATGSQFTEITLDSHQSTLVLGTNGTGKSTMIDAICFCLFNETFRNITKPLIVNTINKKDCVVELEFKIGSKEYLVRRGIKPNLFEIWVDGAMVNQDASRDYQAYLEEHVLKMNFKTFTRIIVLGAADYVPFMKLTTGARREVTETILDVNVFSWMNAGLSQKLREVKASIKTMDGDIDVARTKIGLIQKYIKTLETDNDKRIENLRIQVATAETEITDLINTKKEQEVKIQVLERGTLDYQNLLDAHKNLAQEQSVLNAEVAGISKQISLFEEHAECPTCTQSITDLFRDNKLSTLQQELEQRQTRLGVIRDDLRWLSNRLMEINTAKAEIAEFKNQIGALNTKINFTQQTITKLNAEIDKPMSGNVDEEKAKLRELAKDALELTKRRDSLIDTKFYYDICATLLKDGGIKANIIRETLPVLNKLINQYLVALDFPIHFELDENFNETIKSRHRDSFKYESFSEGQKQRIDLAIMLAWRSIARMRANASSNLLICDEILDSSSDAQGNQCLLAIFKEMTDSNIFVISHSPERYQDHFESAINFKMTLQGYSVMERT